MAQGVLGAAGVRHVWAGAGLQRAAYRGRGILLLLLLLLLSTLIRNTLHDVWLK